MGAKGSRASKHIALKCCNDDVKLKLLIWKAHDMNLDRHMHLINEIFTKQFGITFLVDYRYLELERIDDAIALIDKFARIQKSNAHDLHLYVTRGLNDIVGISYVDGLGCELNYGVSSNNYKVMAHELGHIVGARHTIGLGGIMDYSDGKYEGVVQFHPNNRKEICKCVKLNKRISGDMEAFAVPPNKPFLEICRGLK